MSIGIPHKFEKPMAVAEFDQFVAGDEIFQLFLATGGKPLDTHQVARYRSCRQKLVTESIKVLGGRRIEVERWKGPMTWNVPKDFEMDFQAKNHTIGYGAKWITNNTNGRLELAEPTWGSGKKELQASGPDLVVKGSKNAHRILHAFMEMHPGNVKNGGKSFFLYDPKAEANKKMEASVEYGRAVVAIANATAERMREIAILFNVRAGSDEEKQAALIAAISKDGSHRPPFSISAKKVIEEFAKESHAAMSAWISEQQSNGILEYDGLDRHWKIRGSSGSIIDSVVFAPVEQEAKSVLIQYLSQPQVFERIKEQCDEIKNFDSAPSDVVELIKVGFQAQLFNKEEEIKEKGKFLTPYSWKGLRGRKAVIARVARGEDVMGVLKEFFSENVDHRAELEKRVRSFLKK